MTFSLNMIEEEYHAIPAVSASGLKRIMQSPAHYEWEYVLGNKQDKPVFKEGKAIHCALLEPEKFEKTYIVAPKYNGALKQKKPDNNEIGCLEYLSWLSEKANIDCYSTEKTTIKEIRQEIIVFERLISNYQIISQDDMDMITGIAASLAKHQYIVDMLSNIQSEISLFWQRNGVDCKARIDLVGAQFIGELKSTVDASPAGFARQIYNMRYHMSAAWYMEGLTAQPELEALSRLPFKFIAVEKTPPYAVAVYELDDESLAVGSIDCDTAFLRLMECRESGKYPDYGEYERMIGIPEYAKKQLNLQGNYYE